jgi:hypothetical protein
LSLSSLLSLEGAEEILEEEGEESNPPYSSLVGAIVVVVVGTLDYSETPR